MTPSKTALIVIDSGFSVESLAGADRVIATIDLVNRQTSIGKPHLSQAQLDGFASDPGNHGSIVLRNLRRLAPERQLILIRAIHPEWGVVRTGWAGGKVASDGWTEAYLQAVAICKERGLFSVANCSFGGVVHDAKGGGWEAYQLEQVTGKGKPGHIVVAAAGAGDGRSCHASWVVPQGSAQTIEVMQNEGTHYNLWAGAHADWTLEVYLDGRHVHTHEGSRIPLNLWTPRQQLNFFVEGQGLVTFVVRREAQENAEALTRFDCYIVRDTARFHNHVDPTLIVEPAAFNCVIAVGLTTGSYTPGQEVDGEKPDMLLPGNGPISFRIQEVVVRAADLLDASDGKEAVDDIRRALGKHPFAS